MLLTYQSYLAVDRMWDMALRDMNIWFSVASKLGASIIGNPGSLIRPIHDHRDRVIRQLKVARIKLEISKKRQFERCQNTQLERILLITNGGH